MGAMAVPYVTSFCWCLGLEVGTKLVGFVHLAAAGSLMVLCAVFARDAGTLAGTTEDAGDHIYTTWYRVAVAVTLACVGHVLLASALLCGVFMRKAGLVRLWVYVMLVLFCAGIAFCAVTAATHGVVGSGSDIFLAFLQGLILFGGIAYAVLAVHSYYLMLRSAQELDIPHKQDY